jgi:uncharacterized protein YqgV (UPF0045/DUF77 family)
MAEKKFNKKYMHPTRRKLVNMIQTGEYQKDTQITLSDIKETTKREVGDIWEENGVIWEQKEYGKVKQSKLSSELAKVRQYLEQKSQCKSSDCTKSKYGPTDKTLISKTGYCSKCLAEREQIIKKDGLWEAYNEYKVYSNMAAYGTEVLAKWNQALNEVSNIHEYINDDGSVEKWSSNEDVQTLKAQIETDIENGKKELTEVIEKRNAAYELLKDKNYELVQPL